MNLFKKLKDPKTRKELFKYSVVGTSTFLLDFAVMALILFISNPSSFDHNYFKAFYAVPTGENAPTTAAVVAGTGIGFIISFMCNYILSVFFVYHYGAVGKSKSGFIKFLVFALAGFIVHSLGEFIGYDLLSINLWAVKIVLSLAIFFFNYFTRKRFIFNIELIRDDEITIRL